LEATHGEQIRRLEEEHAQEVYQQEEEHRRQHRTQAQMGEEAVSSARRISTQEVQLEAARADKAQAERTNRELRLERDNLESQKKHLEQEYRQMERWYAELQEEVDAVLKSSDATEAEVKALKAQLYEQKEAAEQAQQRETRVRYEFDKKLVGRKIPPRTGGRS